MLKLVILLTDIQPIQTLSKIDKLTFGCTENENPFGHLLRKNIRQVWVGQPDMKKTLTFNNNLNFEYCENISLLRFDLQICDDQI